MTTPKQAVREMLRDSLKGLKMSSKDLAGIPGETQPASGVRDGEAAAFTPGPWECREYGSPRGRYYVQDANGTSIAQSLKCSLADARLIAAAPDGLEAAMNTYWKLLTLTQVRHVLQPQLCALRDFIAKATGNDPQVVQDQYEALATALGPSAQDTTERQPEPREAP